MLSNQFHDHAALTLKKELPVLICSRLDGNESWCWHCGKENMWPHREINPEYPAV